MKRVLVTGGAGFIGSAVVRNLIALNYQVAVLLREKSNTNRLINLEKNFKVIHGDLTQISNSENEIKDFSPQVTIHLAWAGVKGSDRNHVSQVMNIVASIDLYKMVTSAGSMQFIGLGSQAEYGPQGGRVDELAKTSPTTLYGIAKLSTFMLLSRMALLDNVIFSWPRLFSSYGPGDNLSWLLPGLIAKLLDGKRPALTSCEQLWDYIYVDDVASAIIALLENKASGPFNLGSGEANKLLDIVSDVRDRIDPSLSLGIGEIPYRPDQVMHLEADITAIRKATGWSPLTTLDAGLEKTIEFYRNERISNG